jgi:photosystem II stability/assembly factor-like uncharacterized protein
MKLCRIVAIYSAIIHALAISQLAGAGDDTWTTEGPYGASVKTIAVHPNVPGTLLIGTIENGIYKTNTAGESWVHIESDIVPTTLRKIVYHPLRPDTVYATAEGGVFLSGDGGNNWADISPPGRSGQEFRAIVLDPRHPHVILTGGVFDRWKSTDGGQSWIEFSIDPEWPGGPDHEIDAMAIDPINTNIVYLVTPDAEFGRGIYKSTDQGETWFNVHNKSDSSGGGTDVAIDWANPQTVYYARIDDLRVSAGHFLSKSTDAGASWFDISPPNLSLWGVFTLYISPWDHNTIFAGTVNDGLYKSTNGGASWAPADSGLNTHGCSALASDAGGDVIYLGLFYDGIYKSINRGSSWHKISQNIIGVGINGLSYTHTSPPTIFAASHMGCYTRSPDEETWQYIAMGLSPATRPGAIELDYFITSNIYVAVYATSYPPPVSCGLMVSTNGGNTWGLFNNGLPLEQSFGDIAISYSADSTRRIFLTTNFDWLSSSGIYYSDDVGRSWNRCVNGLQSYSHFYIASAPNNPDIVTAAAYNGYVYISTDMGDNWFSPSNRTWRAIDLRFDPIDDSTLYLSSLFDGLYKSSDLGNTWANINNDLPVDANIAVYVPAINPYNPQNMFVSSAHHGVYETRDGGAHWVSFNIGLDTARCFGPIYFAPGDTTRLYLATLNASVWSIHRTLTGVEEEEPNLPARISLSAYPNPFNSATTFTTNLEDDFTIDIFDITGAKIASLTARDGRAVWDASVYSSGVYFARAHNGTGERVIKIILLK